MDDNFRKGRIIVDPDKELSATIDVTYKLQQDIFGLVKNLDAIYEFITQPMDTNLLENYLLKKGWVIDFSSSPFNGHKPGFLAMQVAAKPYLVQIK